MTVAGGIDYRYCKHCSTGIKRRRDSDGPWLHVRSKKQRSDTPYAHNAEPVDLDYPNPVPEARPGWYGHAP